MTCFGSTPFDEQKKSTRPHMRCRTCNTGLWAGEDRHKRNRWVIETANSLKRTCTQKHFWSDLG